MHIQYFKEYSHCLNRDMEFKVYGHGGKPFVVFPSQDGKFYDFENQGMVDCVKDFIENGKIQLFCIQSVDAESWSGSWDKHTRIMWHEQWFHYVCDEFMPRLYAIHNELAHDNFSGRVMTTGCSMGGYHAVNFFLRRPDLFEGCLSLSGLFHAGYFFGDYNDEMIYFNSPCDFLPNMEYNHPLVQQYRHSTIILCCGQGAWEDEAKKDACALKTQFNRLNVDAWVDLWGFDVNHDWPWWRIQFPYFIERILKDAA